MKHPITCSTPMLIHLFAAAHAVIAVVSRMVNYVDDVPLTVLTLALIIIISLRHNLQAEIIAILSLVGTFAGFFLGSYGATLIGALVHNPTIASALTTALFTELLGWCIYLFARTHDKTESTPSPWAPSLSQIVALASIILLFRISYTLIFDSGDYLQTGIYTEFRQLLSNRFAVLVLLCGNVFFVSLRPHKHRYPELRHMSNILLIALFSLIVSLLVHFNFPKGTTQPFLLLPFLRLYAVILLADTILYALCKLIAYLLISKAELRSERGKKHLAQFQYDKLKLQINPHFLFNSLNILDFLVQEQETERASAFIRKLAECYRYMLKTEEEPLVPLSEEIAFAEKYTALLQERFTSGFSVQYDIPQQMRSRFILPCALQLLIENVTKHNIVSPDRPLTVRVRVENDLIIVSNNLQPRLSTHASTGMGLKNIRRQYEDLANRSIRIVQTDTDYIVELPLL